MRISWSIGRLELGKSLPSEPQLPCFFSLLCVTFDDRFWHFIVLSLLLPFSSMAVIESEFLSGELMPLFITFFQGRQKWLPICVYRRDSLRTGKTFPAFSFLLTRSIGRRISGKKSEKGESSTVKETKINRPAKLSTLFLRSAFFPRRFLTLGPPSYKRRKNKLI